MRRSFVSRQRSMDPLFLALHLFRRRKFAEASDKCSEILAKTPLDQSAWVLKLRCLTQQVYVDEVENDEEGIAESTLDDNTISTVFRPGTSLQKPGSSMGTGISPAVRPRTQTGRPLSGMVRPGTQGGRPGTMEQALRTPRTAATARPVTSSSGRSLRLGTASMLSNPDGPFVNISRLNFSKYAKTTALAWPLFEYLFYHENDVRNALELASLATQACRYENWFWKSAIGMCYYRLGLYRDAEKQFRSATKHDANIDCFLHLGKVYCRLDQPLAAVDIYQEGLKIFPNDINLLTGIARVYEGLDNPSAAVDSYKQVLKQDITSVEAIACIGANHFYTDQPELALHFYRRLLQMGVSCCEVLTNIGLCCFYSQQYDMAVSCLERALATAEGEVVADIWYNIGMVVLTNGDTSMAYYAFRLALATNPEHAEAFTNLGVLEMRKGNDETATTYFERAIKISNFSFEPRYNLALLQLKKQELGQSLTSVKKAIEIYPGHADSVELRNQISKYLTSL